jgi:hypothetical protein
MVIVKNLEEWPEDQYNRELSITGILSSIDWPDQKEDAEGFMASPVGLFYYIQMNPTSTTGQATTPIDNNPLEVEGK